MRKYFLLKNRRGFTLTEVLIGIMILTMAIVSAGNLLASLINSNQNNLGTLQAYYYAQEGLEAVRNIRDSNWLHNKDWLKSGDIWGEDFEEGHEYFVDMERLAFSYGGGARTGDFADVGEVKIARPWTVATAVGERFIQNVNGEGEDFQRVLSIKPYEGGHVLVESRVRFMLGKKDREVVLSEVLTNWKMGVL